MADTEKERDAKVVGTLVLGLLFVVGYLVLMLIEYLGGSEQDKRAKARAQREVVTLEYVELLGRYKDNEVAAKRYFETVNLQMLGAITAIKAFDSNETPALLHIEDARGFTYGAFVLKSDLPKVERLRKNDVVRITCDSVLWGDNKPWVNNCVVEQVQ